jgi:hypothetical protein
MTNGSTTFPVALFTPATATHSFSNFGPGAFVNFRLFDAPPEGEELFLNGQHFHTGYQSGVQANPFFELQVPAPSPATTPEPSSYLFLDSVSLEYY